MLPAPSFFYRRWRWLLVWCLITALGCLLLGRWQLGQLRDAFETDARIAHRLLSQRAVQHDAVMAMLALVQAPPAANLSPLLWGRPPSTSAPQSRAPKLTSLQARLGPTCLRGDWPITAVLPD